MIGNIIKNNFRFALDTIQQNIMKSILSILGISVGIGMAVFIMSIGSNLKAYVANQFEEVGIDRMFIYTDDSDYTITEDAVALINGLDLIKQASPYAIKKTLFEDGHISGNINIVGVYDNYKDIAHLNIVGSYVGNKPENGYDNICVISDDVRKTYVYKDINPIGQSIMVGDYSYRIVGYIQPDSLPLSNVTTPDVDMAVYIPYNTFAHNYSNEKISMVMTTLSNMDMILECQNQIKSIFRYECGSSQELHMKVLKDSLDELYDTINKVQVVITAISIIIMIISGIGIMNVLIATISEKKREIGIRKSIGASNVDIVLQYVFYVILLCMSGAIFGVLLAREILNIIRVVYNSMGNSMESPLNISMDAILLGILFNIIIAFAAGIYPVIKASRCSPLEAMK